jgi:hypothetical protein
MMPCESWDAREAALLRMQRASARTMAEEMAARWCGNTEWGEARPSPRCGGHFTTDDQELALKIVGDKRRKTRRAPSLSLGLIL